MRRTLALAGISFSLCLSTAHAGDHGPAKDSTAALKGIIHNLTQDNAAFAKAHKAGYIIDLNGETDAAKLAKHPLLSAK